METRRMILGAKVATVFAWLCSAVAIIMVTNLTDSYGQGYEDMANDAFRIFILGALISAASSVATVTARRHDHQSVAMIWVVAASTHMIGSILLIGALIV